MGGGTATMACGTVTALLLLSMLLTYNIVLCSLHYGTNDGLCERLSSCGGLRNMLHLSGVSCCSRYV